MSGEATRSLVERLRHGAQASAILLREAADQIEADAERTKALEEAMQMIRNDPYGCPACDSGKLRLPNKDHWPRCGFAKLAELTEHV